ncbi:hypothetical protein ACFLT2_13790 [Acidobacteriota bacterium]
MKQFKKRKSNVILVGVLVFIFLISAFAPSLDAGVCKRALYKCGIDAAIAGATGGVITGIAWGSVCLAGYDWCLKYYIQ